jgi:hypothetical protein
VFLADFWPGETREFRVEAAAPAAPPRPRAFVMHDAHRLIVERWYKKGHDEYHVDRGEGADFYEENDDHYLAVSTAKVGVPTVQYVDAGWTASGDFRSVEEWWRHLELFSQRLAHPVKVSFPSSW